MIKCNGGLVGFYELKRLGHDPSFLSRISSLLSYRGYFQTTVVMRSGEGSDAWSPYVGKGYDNVGGKVGKTVPTHWLSGTTILYNRDNSSYFELGRDDQPPCLEGPLIRE